MKLQEYDLTNAWDVDLTEPPGKRWVDVVEETGDHIQEIVADVIEYCEAELPAAPGWMKPLIRTAVHGGARLGGTVVGIVARLFGQEYQAEIKGIARQAGVSYAQLLLGNLMYDLSQLYEHYFLGGGQPTACSSYSCNLPDGSPVLARNMDWEVPESLGRHTLLLRHHRGKRSYLSVGVAGMVGVLSAMQPGHWAVTLNQAPIEHIQPRWLQTPALQRLRQVCDGFGGYRNLVRRIQEYQTMTPFFAHVVGAKRGQHMVINGLGDSFVERRMDGRRLIQTNHFVDEDLAYLNGAEEWQEEDGSWLTCDSQPRYEALERRLRALPRTVDEARGKLQRGR